MKTLHSAKTRSASGMTLMEVLAAVLILGLGLIMVYGAFPVAAIQSRQTMEVTEASVLGRSALDLSRQERLVRDLVPEPTDDPELDTVEELKFKTIKGSSVNEVEYSKAWSSREVIPVNTVQEELRVWNANRWAYMEDGIRADTQQNASKRQTLVADDTMWPPQNTDYIWQPFVTRLNSDPKEPPLFRLTVVVSRLEPQSPDFYDKDHGAVVRYFPMQYRNDGKEYKQGHLRRRCLVKGGIQDEAGPGDVVMDSATGYCYRVVASVDGSSNDNINGNDPDRLVLASDPQPQMDNSGSKGRNFYVFSSPVAVFYSLISD